jgi:renalase
MSPGAALPRVAIVGAGMSGLSCARTLLSRGSASVVVLEKSRGFGGRCATREWRGSVIDHGVQFFTLRSALIRQLITETLPLAPGDLRTLPLAAVRTAADHAPVHIASGERMYLASGNGTLGAVFALDIDVRLEHTIAEVDPSGRVEYSTADGQRKVEHFDAVVCSAPLPQTAAILGMDTPPDWDNAFMPNLTAIFEYDVNALSPSALCHPPGGSAPRLYALYAPHDDATLTWSACENAKAGRTIAAGKAVMIAQASDAFSAAHFGDDDGSSAAQGDSVGDGKQPAWVEEMAASVEETWQLDPSARVAALGKRWRYARVDPRARARDISTVEQPADRIFVCGDGVARRSRMEHAILNGHYAAQRVASAFSTGTQAAWSVS